MRHPARPCAATRISSTRNLIIPMPRPLLSIAIPAYDRPKQLLYALERFIAQIDHRFEREIEIRITDDASPDDALAQVRRLCHQRDYLHYRRHPKNIGLERNLISCTDDSQGEYLWLFGDDDFLEADDALETIMTHLRRGEQDVLVLNRTRRSFDLSRILSENWMRLDPQLEGHFGGLREFCLRHGFISVIGFISVNIFRRTPYQAVDAGAYLGTMYPQLGAMLEAFHSSSTLLLGRPLICHRTQTQEEKRQTLGAKPSEADFMSDVRRRNAVYFSHPYIGMLSELLRQGAFTPADLVRIPECTVINGKLVDFLIQCTCLNHEMDFPADKQAWRKTRDFFESLPLNAEQAARIDPIIEQHTDDRALNRNRQPTLSVITPSFNQARFLPQCLESVCQQNLPPIEHLVFDPGSSDGSREIARTFPGVTLVEEPDEGQPDALNRGFQRVCGDIIAWINSDDSYAASDVFSKVVERFGQADDPDIVYGRGIYVDADGNKLRDAYINTRPDTLVDRLQHEVGIMQPAAFMRRRVIEKIGPLRSDRHFTLDYEYWIRCVKAGLRFAFLDQTLARASYHTDNKTYGMRANSYAEVCDVMKEHFGYVHAIWVRRYAEFLSEGYDGVLKTAANSGLADQARFDGIYRELLRDYNADHDSYNLLLADPGDRPHTNTLREMREQDISPPAPCKPIPLDRTREPGHACYTVGSRRWAYRAQWKQAQIERSHAFLRRRIAVRNKDVCVIVGSGPSLRHTDLGLLEGQDVIASNNTFLSLELFRHVTYYTVVNYLVAEQSCHNINRLRGVAKILPYWLSYCLHPGDDSYFVDAVGYPEFSTDIFRNMSWRHTVSFFNLHLAYGLGYRKVVLVGFDHEYRQPEGVKEQEIIVSPHRDMNHFVGGYFQGKRWQAADVNMMEEMYRLAKTAFEVDGRRIVNATVGGRLELFPRQNLAQALDLTHPT
ncbi:glycosyltransferase [Thiocystis violacea]|uniref:glycosyltransferase n=1 Tax=Thiocystis violacea TaxID=13725 RepID=UPI0019061968|nr:glycosyltransferase [Thiocystis violacea]MBK1720033.1 hypothetical protein [Thiocystis violacea]